MKNKYIQRDKQARKLRTDALKALATVDRSDYGMQARLWDCVFTNSTLGQLKTIRETLIRVQDRYFKTEPQD